MIQKEEVSKEIFLLRGLFHPAQCQQSRDFCEAQGMEKAGLGNDKIQEAVRNNDRLLHTDVALAAGLRQKTQSFFSLKN